MKKKLTLMVVLEGHFYRDKNGKVWCNRIFSYDFFKRYLDVFDNLKVCVRITDVDYDCTKMLLVSGPNVTFVALPEFGSIITMAKKYFEIRKIIRANINSIDCCIMRAPNHLSIMLFDIFKKNNVPIALELVISADKLLQGESVKAKIINKYIDKKTKKMCLKANGVAYVTETILQKKYPCYHITHPEDNSYFEANYSSIDLDESAFYFNDKLSKPTEYRIVHTGYMDSNRKGQLTLINAINYLVKNNFKNIKLVLIGDGKLKNNFQDKVKELGIDKYVEFKGLIVDKKDIYKELRKSDIFAFPTQAEGLPRSIIEAMANGLPVISSPVDGIPELIDSDLLVNYWDYVGYGKKLIELIENFEYMKIIARKNYEKSKKYEHQILKNNRIEFYNKLKNISVKNMER